MKRRGGEAHAVTGFYMETLLLTSVFVLVLLILTQVFAASRLQSAEAKLLNEAVTLAADGAEAAAASDSEEQLFALLNENGNAVSLGGAVEARYDDALAPASGGAMLLRVSWEPQEGGLVRSVIEVYRDGRDAAVYTLETAVFTGEEAAA